MGIGDDMKALAQEITDSYEARVKYVLALRKETAVILRGFRSDHRRMSVQLKDALAAGDAQRVENARKLLGDYRKERAEAAAAWRKLAVTLQKRRAEVTAKGVVWEKAPPPPTLGDKIFLLLKEHPQGLRLVDIVEITGKSKAKLNEVLKNLRLKGKVEKKDSRYFSRK